MKLDRVLYIGQFQPGTTSYSRGCFLRELLPNAEFGTIDTLEPFYSTPKVFRSIGFRWKIGPLISRVNDFVSERVANAQFDLIWVDKGVFLTESTTRNLRSRTKLLVHFTPDPALKYHRSRHFLRSLKHYDKVVTTKSYEIEDYSMLVDQSRLLLVTQGFDPKLHFPRKEFNSRIPGVCFIGHHEAVRQSVIEAILKAGIAVFVAGRGWERVARAHSRNRRLEYGGEGLFGDDYSARISDYQIGLGFLSKWVPEKHTTRTFEIPACGSILATERNSETRRFFEEADALFFSSTSELVDRIQSLIDSPTEASEIASRGFERVQSGGYDYKVIVSKVLESLNDV